MKKILSALAAGALSLAMFAPTAFGTESSEGQDENGNDTNQVDCGTETAEVPGLIQVNAGGGPDGGYVEVCNDNDNGLIQGSAYAEGSTSGGSVAADGDADNENDTAKGWAKVHTDGTYECGGAETGDWNSRDGGGTAEQCG